MTGTFSQFNTALTTLRYNSVLLQNASNNIANASVEGYARRRVNGAEVGGPDRPAMYARYDGHGEGVGIASVQRQVDPLLDARVRREHGMLAYLQTQESVLTRVESGIGEPGDNGVAAALADFKQSWEDLANNPDVPAPRQQVLVNASILADALATQSRNITGEIADQRVKADSLVSEVNTALSDLAELNQKIYVTGLNGIDNNSLQDTRDQLALRLSELTGAQTKVDPATGMYDIELGGVSLVSASSASAMAIDTTGAPPAVTVGGAGVAVSGLGELGATVDLLDPAKSGSLPDYLAELNSMVEDFADTINNLHDDGFDLAGNPGGQFFSYDSTVGAAASLKVEITSENEVAASLIPGGNYDHQNADAIYENGFGAATAEYQRLVNSFGSNVAAIQRKAANQEVMTAQVDDTRESQAGVNLDEETVHMVMAQRSYEAAGKLMNVIDGMLETLINMGAR